MHRERVFDFWLTAAVTVALFIPIWGVLLRPTGLIRLPIYLLYLGVPALAVVLGALIYGARRNRVLLNRFLVGYAGGFTATAIFTLLTVGAGPWLDTPNVAVALGQWVLERPLTAPVTPAVIAVGMAYHFLLNGAAWGAAYALLFGKAPWWLGLLFGFFIWAVLVLSPPFYQWGLAGAASGAWLLIALLLVHFVYGGIVGYIVYRWVFPEVGMEGIKAIRPLYA